MILTHLVFFFFGGAGTAAVPSTDATILANTSLSGVRELNDGFTVYRKLTTNLMGAWAVNKPMRGGK